jgi:hypothetical protein
VRPTRPTTQPDKLAGAAAIQGDLGNALFRATRGACANPRRVTGCATPTRSAVSVGDVAACGLMLWSFSRQAYPARLAALDRFLDCEIKLLLDELLTVGIEIETRARRDVHRGVFEQLD